MTELIVKSAQADAVRSEVRTALDNQQNAIQDSIERTRKNLDEFAVKYGISTADLLERESQGTLVDDNLEFIEWIGEARILERLEAELKLLQEIEIC